MMFFFLSGSLFLGWSLGRNNLSNSFGLAVGTRMLPFFLSAACASVFVFLGALISGSATVENILRLTSVQDLSQAFIVSLSAASVILFLTRLGLPVSIAQASIGSLVGFSLYSRFSIDWNILKNTVFAWLYSPFLALITAFVFFKLVRLFLKKNPIGLLYRDFWVRIGLIGAGCFSAYALGANNVPGIIGIYGETFVFSEIFLLLLVCASISAGFFLADKKVILTVSKGVFPLGPLEAWCVVSSGALTLLLFSSVEVKNFFEFLGVPSFPLIPISVSHAMIGAIVGVGLAKGHAGLKRRMIERIIFSWAVVPVSAGLISAALCAIIELWRG